MASSASAEKRILVVDGHPSICQWLRREIGRQPDLTVSADAPDAVTAWTELTAQPPDLLILGLALVGSHGLDFLAEVRARGHEFPVLVFSQFQAEINARLAREAGAQGFLNKRADSRTVIAAIRTLLAGGTLFPAEPAGTAGFAALNEGEVQVFQLSGQGLTNLAIAQQLQLKLHSVENHRSALMRKLGLPNGNALTATAAVYIHLGRQAQSRILPALFARPRSESAEKRSFPQPPPGVYPTVPARPILDAGGIDYHI